MARTPIVMVKNKKQKRIAANFQENVIKKRTELGLRQVEFAIKCGLSKQYIADIEQGLSGNPTLETICEIAAGLGISDPLELLK